MSRRDASIYVGRLSKNTRTRDLEEIFEPYGRLLRCDIKYGSEMAYAFIDFEDRRDAEDCVKYEHGRELNGQAILVEWAKGGKDRRMSSWRSDSSSQSYDECFRCRRTGHWARDCPEMRYGGGGGGRRGGGGGGGGRRWSPSPRRRSRSRDRNDRRKSRSRSRDRDRRRRSRSRDRRRSRSRSDDRKRSRSRSGSRKSRSASVDRKKDSRSRSREKTRASLSRSRSKSPRNSKSKSRSLSRSPRGAAEDHMDEQTNGNEETRLIKQDQDDYDDDARSHSRSRSRSHSQD